MVHTTENEFLSITVHEKGAEIQSIIDKGTGQEYLWAGDPKFWGKKSPVLFPIVGSLKENTYYYNGQSYHLSRHGFARDLIFSVTKESPGQISFVLKSNASTLENYPFEFEFSLHYLLNGKTCAVTYEIKNNGGGSMFFSVGGHPAFIFIGTLRGLSISF